MNKYVFVGIPLVCLVCVGLMEVGRSDVYSRIRGLTAGVFNGGEVWLTDCGMLRDSDGWPLSLQEEKYLYKEVSEALEVDDLERFHTAKAKMRPVTWENVYEYPPQTQDVLKAMLRAKGR